MDTRPGNSRAWSTLGASEAFEHWREVVCQAFTKLSPERLDREAFAGDIQLSDVAGLGTISRITASRQRVDRNRGDVSERPCDAVFVNIQVAGTSKISQCGMEASLGPGSFVMLDARRPFRMRFDSGFRQICLHLPLQLLGENDFEPAGAIARRIDRDRPFGAAFLRQVDAILGDEVEDDPSDHLVTLLRLASSDLPNALADQHLDLIRRYVARNCRDWSMSPGMAARQFRISVRHVHKLFARSGETFGQYLLNCRLRESHREILSNPKRSVLDIGLACGFRSASHFSRSFRKAFGHVPSALTKQ